MEHDCVTSKYAIIAYTVPVNQTRWRIVLNDEQSSDLSNEDSSFSSSKVEVELKIHLFAKED